MALARRPWLGVFLVLLAASMFALLGPVSRLAYEGGMEPLPFVVWRAGVGALILALLVGVLARSAGSDGRRGAVGRGSIGWLGLATLMGLVLNLAIFAAFQRVSVALALLGFYLYPAGVALGSALLGRERLTGRVLGALGLALGGMALVVAGGMDPSRGLVIDPLGLAFALAAAASQTVFVLASRGYRSVPAEQAMGVILAGTVAGGVLIALFAGPATVAALGEPLRTPALLPILLVAGSVGAAIPSLLFLRGIRQIGGTRTGILMLFEPVVGAALAAALLSETLRPIQLAGGGAILLAAYLLQAGGRAEASPDEAAPPVV